LCVFFSNYLISQKALLSALSSHQYGQLLTSHVFPTQRHHTLSDRLPKKDLSLQKSFSNESLFLYNNSASSADILSEVTIAI